jgi:WD40 repeat protein
MTNYNKEILFFRLYINDQTDEINITYIKHYKLQVMINVYDLLLSPDESKLLVYGIKTYFDDDDFESNVIEIFDICTDSFIFLINGIDYTHTPINYNNNPNTYEFLNNDTLIVGCDSNYIQIWNINKSEIEDTLYSDYKICSIKIMNHSPNVFIAGTSDGNIIIFDLNRSQYITKIYNHLMIPIINPDPDIFRSINIRNILIDKNDELIYVTFPGNIYTSPHKLKILSTNKYKNKQLFTFLLILYRTGSSWVPYELCDLILKFF